MANILPADTLFENRYRVLAALGQGGMGAVYRVADEARDGQILALKVLTMDARLPGVVSDFQREFSILTQLRHPNLVGVHEYGVASTGELYFTMEHLSGRNLKSHLLNKPLSPAFPLIVQVCRALAYLHARDILHGDLKPSNILVVDDQVRLLDFGIAREVGGQLPAGSVTSGTLGYMAPEVKERKAVDHRADLYSLGAMMYELITGTPPEFLVGTERLAVLALEDALIERDEPYPDLIPVVTRLLAASPVDRYPSANAVIDALNDATGNAYALETRETAASYALRGRFVGRQAEFAALQTAWKQVQPGDSQIVLVNGPSGTGKSRLVEEFALQSELSGTWVVRGRCAESGRSAYQPWREALRVLVRYVESSDPAAMQRLGPVLATLLPELWQRAYLADAAAPPALDPEAERLRLNETICQFLRLAAAVRPTLITIDDAQWGDEASLELLDFLSRIPPLGSLLTIVIYRDDELAARHPLAALAGPRVERVRVHRLSSELISELVASMLGLAALPSLLVERIQNSAAGNAFFVQELVRALAEDGSVLRRTVGGWEVDAQSLARTPMPASIHQVILRRLGHLSALETTVLQIAAVFGMNFWDGALLTLGTLTVEQTEVLLQTLLEKDWLAAWDRTAFVGQAEYTFKHTILRDTVYEHLAEEQRIIYHLQAAEWLVASSAERIEEYTAQIAEHYERAQEHATAGEWYGRAAKHAQATYAPEAAIQYYRKALLYLNETPEEILKRCSYYEGLCESLHWQTLFSEGLEAAKAMLAAAQAAADSTAQARAWLRICESRRLLGELPEALEAAKQAEQMAHQADNHAIVAAALADQGFVCYNLGDAAAALIYGEQALLLGSEIDSQRVVVDALNALAAAHWILGNHQQVAHYFQRALEMVQTTGDRRKICSVLNNLGANAFMQGDYQTARTHFEDVLQISHEIGYGVGKVLYLNNLGGVQARLGEYQRAEDSLHQVLQLTQASDWFDRPVTYRFLAEALMGQEKLDQAFEAAQHALAQAQEMGRRQHIAGAWLALGMVLARGQLRGVSHPSQSAASCFAESERIFSELGAEGERARVLREWARHELEQGDADRGRVMWQEARSSFERLGLILEAQRMDQG